MIAYTTMTSCYCTVTCCTCNSVDNFYTFWPKPERQRLTLEEMRIPASLLKSWRIWTAWKREVRTVWEVLLPTFDLLPSIMRPCTRERRHVQGHSPRRRSY